MKTKTSLRSYSNNELMGHSDIYYRMFTFPSFFPNSMRGRFVEWTFRTRL